MEEKNSVVKSGIILFIVTLTAVLLLIVVNNVTEPKILQQIELKISKSLREVLPEAFSFSSKLRGKSIDFYKGFTENQEVCGYAFINSGKGYGGDIEVMVGVDLDLTILGVKVIRHAETPGLGSKINEVTSSKTIVSMLKGGPKQALEAQRPWFCKQFIGMKIENLVVTKTEDKSKIQAITGATVSSKAVTKAVREGIKKFEGEL